MAAEGTETKALGAILLFTYSTSPSRVERAHGIAGLQLGNVSTITVVLVGKTHKSRK